MGLAAFADLDGLWFLVRSVDPPAAPHPARTETLLDRGPFTLDGEREVLRRHRIDVVVTKESGGAATAPKLTAAREAGLPVVVVRRPAAPAGVPVVPGPEEALRAVREAYTRHRAAPGGAPAARGGGGPASAGGGPTTAGRVGDGVCGGAVAPTRAVVRAGPVLRVRPVRRARCRRLPGGRAAPGLTPPGNCGGSRRRPRRPRAARPASARNRPAGSSACRPWPGPGPPAARSGPVRRARPRHAPPRPACPAPGAPAAAPAPCPPARCGCASRGCTAPAPGPPTAPRRSGARGSSSSARAWPTCQVRRRAPGWYSASSRSAEAAAPSRASMTSDGLSRSDREIAA